MCVSPKRHLLGSQSFSTMLPAWAQRRTWPLHVNSSTGSTLRNFCVTLSDYVTTPYMTTSNQPPTRLGRGLEAIFGARTEPAAPTTESGVKGIPIRQIRPNPFQPRKEFRPEDLS